MALDLSGNRKMSRMYTLWNLIFSYLMFWSFYLFVFALAGVFYKKRKHERGLSFNKFAVVIPAYKEDAVILKSIQQNLAVDFPKDRFRLFVVADSMSGTTIQQLKKLPIEVLEVQFKNSTKAKAVNAALDGINEIEFTHVVVLDADNVMSTDYLQVIDHTLNDSISVIQTHRMAKNIHTDMAFLDAVNEEVGNHIFRKGHVALGLSSALIGSGMVFQTELFKRLMKPIMDTAGEDKMLEFALLREKIKVNYVEDAVVYDEKISKTIQFEGQRTRWVAARLHFLKKEARHAFSRLLKFDLDYFNKWLQFLLPQKVLLIAYVSLLASVSLMLDFRVCLVSFLLMVLLLTYVLSIPGRFYSSALIFSILKLPKVAFKMIRVLFKATRVNPTSFNVTAKEL